MSARECIIPVFVPHLGCPHQCVFCQQNHITGAENAATPESVSAAVIEATQWIAKGQKVQLAFYGGSFTAIPALEQKQLLDAAQAFVNAGVVDTIRLSTRPDAINEEVICRLRKYSVNTVELGAQSMDDQVLKLSARGHNAQSVREATLALQRAGFQVILQMMTGLPGDTEEKSIATAEEIIRLRPDGVRIYPTVILKDTMLEKLWRSGCYEEHSVETAVELCAKLLPRFEAAGLPVIRLGLNPTEELSGGAAVAGAYHPALGELVRSRILRNQAEFMLQESRAEGQAVSIYVGEKQLSQMKGQHCCNLEYLKERFRLDRVQVYPAKLPKDEIQIVFG